jgi:hypothetical protein
MSRLRKYLGTRAYDTPNFAAVSMAHLILGSSHSITEVGEANVESSRRDVNIKFHDSSIALK